MDDQKTLMRMAQLPIIEERVRDIKAAWDQLAADNAALVCTAETVQTVKSARAALTSQYNELEDQRKAIKAQYMAAYDSFDRTYKECVTDPYKRADAILKSKIEYTEGAIKDECDCKCRRYFEEICAVHCIDFVRYEQIGIKVDLTSAKQKRPRKLYDQINERVAGIADGLDKITREAPAEDRDEYIAEYKQCLDVGVALSTVMARHRRIEEERRASSEREANAQRRAEAVARVQEAAAPVLAAPVAAPPVTARRIPSKISFSIYLESAEQYDQIRPILITLRDTLKSAGIKYN